MHRFDPDNRHRLVSEQRYQMMPPASVLDHLPLRPDAVVGDIGCGPGFFTLPLAEQLPQGRVHAVDVVPVMLQMVQERAEEAGLTNIHTLLSTAQSIPLDPASLDGAFLALVYHEFDDRAAYLAMLRRTLRPGSWLAILEWGERQHPIGGPPLASRIGPEQTGAELAAAGWRVTARHAPNEWMYLLVAELPLAEDEFARPRWRPDCPARALRPLSAGENWSAPPMEASRYPTLIPLPDELRSARIVVRPYRVDDAEAVYAAIDEAREHLARWLPWVHRHQSLDDTRDFCVRAAANWLTRAALEVGIFVAGDGRFLGGTGCPRLNWQARTFEVGYWIRPSAEGHGYVGEAVQLVARLVFEQLAANRLEIRCDARNDRSRAVAERLGFLLEARLRNESLGVDGQPRDSLVLALIPGDYARVRALWWPDRG